MLAHWGDVKDSRSFIDTLFSIKPRNSDLDNLDSLTADVMEAFQVVRETQPQPDQQTVVADGGDFTDAQVNSMLQASHDNVIDQMCMAFLVNFLPLNLRTKVIEKKLNTIKECITEAAKCQRLVLDKSRPVEAQTRTNVFTIPRSLTWRRSSSM